MTDSLGLNKLPHQSNDGESSSEYRARAASAYEAGDSVLAMHLYLAAYERAASEPDDADGMAFSSLREAWNLACDLKERSMAEYVFEKIEPYLTGEEIARYANKLQDLVLDRLEEYGFSREELQDMAESISQDLLDGEASIVKVESISIPHVVATGVSGAIGTTATWRVDDDAPSTPATASAQPDAPGASPDAQHPGRPERIGIGRPGPEFNPYEQYETSSVGTSYHAATNEGAGSYVFTRDADRATALERAQAEAERVQNLSHGDETKADAEPAAADSDGAREQSDQTAAERALAVPTDSTPAKAADEAPVTEVARTGSAPLSYRTLVGYDEAVALMREFGVGFQRDPGFKNFVNMMNARHGIDRMPALDTLLFRAPVIEDAARFTDATIGELDLPVLRMSMEEGMQGMPMLCVTMEGNRRPRVNQAHNRFEGPGILIMEDLDLWEIPQMPENVEGIAGFVMANMSRGAREAMNLIRSAVEDPDVYVLATATTEGEPDPFFYDLLEPMTVIDIAYPTDAERSEIWAEIIGEHSSMSGLDRSALVRYSAGMARYDIYMAARAAVEEAYKAGLAQRTYVPVTAQNVFDKLAACQPLDSDVYRAIEDAVVSSFSEELGDLEDLVGGSAS